VFGPSKRAISLPDDPSHRRAVPSDPDVTNHAPSELYSTLDTVPRCSTRVSRSRLPPAVTSQTFAVPSAPPVTMREPSGAQATSPIEPP
jgi:hypothetical protein